MKRFLVSAFYAQQLQRGLSDRVQRWDKHSAPGNNQQILLFCRFDWLALLVKVSEERQCRRRESESKSESQLQKSPVRKDRSQDAQCDCGREEDQPAREDSSFVSQNHSNGHTNRQQPEELAMLQRKNVAELGEYNFSAFLAIFWIQAVVLFTVVVKLCPFAVPVSVKKCKKWRKYQYICNIYIKRCVFVHFLVVVRSFVTFLGGYTAYSCVSHWLNHCIQVHSWTKASIVFFFVFFTPNRSESTKQV